MSREILTHRTGSALNATLILEAIDDPAPPEKGGANHEYLITTPGVVEGEPTSEVLFINFQNGTLPESDGTPNGVSCEALIAINIDRLESFQAGPFACQDNADALEHLRLALHCLARRTKDRQDRSVEGKHEV